MLLFLRLTGATGWRKSNRQEIRLRRILMAGRNSNLRDIEKQLNPLYYEISLLKFRVLEAGPEVRTQYRDQISNLSAQYTFVESQVQNWRDAEKDLREEQIIRAEENLQELQKNLDTVGQWIYIETANQVYSYY
jgi:chromosome segregation ATPase